MKITLSEKKKNNPSYEKGENLHWNTNKGGVNILKVTGKNTKGSARARTHNLQIWMWLVDLNYIFEWDWLMELSDHKLSNNKLSNNKLSDNNLASELVENRTFLNQSQSEEIVIFIINQVIFQTNCLAILLMEVCSVQRH